MEQLRRDRQKGKNGYWSQRIFLLNWEYDLDASTPMSGSNASSDLDDSIVARPRRSVWKTIVDIATLTGLAVAVVFGLSEHIALQDTRSQLRYEHTQLDNANVMLRGAAAKSTELLDALHEIGQGSGHLRTVLQENKALEARVGNLNQKISALNAQAQASDAALQASRQERADLEQKVSGLTAQMRASVVALQTSVREKSNLEQKVAGLSAQPQSTDAALQASAEEKADLEEKVAALKRQIATQPDYNKMVRKYNGLVYEYSLETKRLADKYNVDVKKYSDQYNDLVRKYNSLASNNSSRFFALNSGNGISSGTGVMTTGVTGTVSGSVMGMRSLGHL